MHHGSTYLQARHLLSPCIQLLVHSIFRTPTPIYQDAQHHRIMQYHDGDPQISRTARHGSTHHGWALFMIILRSKFGFGPARKWTCLLNLVRKYYERGLADAVRRLTEEGIRNVRVVAPDPSASKAKHGALGGVRTGEWSSSESKIYARYSILYTTAITLILREDQKALLTTRGIAADPAIRKPFTLY